MISSLDTADNSVNEECYCSVNQEICTQNFKSRLTMFFRITKL